MCGHVHVCAHYMHIHTHLCADITLAGRVSVAATAFHHRPLPEAVLPTAVSLAITSGIEQAWCVYMCV